MKRTLKAAAAICFIVLFAGVLNACAEKMPTGSTYSMLREAIENSLQYKTYYIQEMVTHDKLLDKTTVNLRCEQDDNYQPVVKDGRLSDYKTEIHIIQKDLPVSDILCGVSKSADGVKKDCLFRVKYEQINGKSQAVLKTAEEKRIEDFVDSDEFTETYSLKHFLKELMTMEEPDFDFSGQTAKAEMKNHLTVLSFAVTDDYLKRYENLNGRPSVFEQSDRVEIELIYNRVASVVTFRSYNDKEFNTTFEESPYKLFITYYGPKFDIPRFDAKTDKGAPEWAPVS